MEFHSSQLIRDLLIRFRRQKCSSSDIYFTLRSMQGFRCKHSSYKLSLMWLTLLVLVLVQRQVDPQLLQLPQDLSSCDSQAIMYFDSLNGSSFS